MISIIGLDLSLTSTGVATHEALTALQAPDRRRKKGEARTDVDNVRRLDWLAESLLEQVRLARQECDLLLAVIEGYSFSSKGNALFQIGEWGGVARLELFRARVPYVTVSPSQLKVYATGHSQASKEEVISAVTHRAGILFEGKGANDKCDAWVLRQMGLAWYWAQSLDGFGHFSVAPPDLVKMPAVQLKAALAVPWPTL